MLIFYAPSRARGSWEPYGPYIQNRDHTAQSDRNGPGTPAGVVIRRSNVRSILTATSNHASQDWTVAAHYTWRKIESNYHLCDANTIDYHYHIPPPFNVNCLPLTTLPQLGQATRPRFLKIIFILLLLKYYQTTVQSGGLGQARAATYHRWNTESWS